MIMLGGNGPLVLLQTLVALGVVFLLCTLFVFRARGYMRGLREGEAKGYARGRDDEAAYWCGVDAEALKAREQMFKKFP